MSEQSRKVKNPLLTAAGQGFPFEGYSTNSLLMPVTPATPAILQDASPEEISLVNEPPITGIFPQQGATSTEIDFTIVQDYPTISQSIETTKIDGNNEQPTRHSYFTSILSSLPNLSLSTITGDAPVASSTTTTNYQQQSVVAPNPGVTRDTTGSYGFLQNPYGTPATTTTSVPFIATDQTREIGRQCPQGFGEIGFSGPTTSFTSPPPGPPPTVPALPPSGGPGSYRLGNQRRLKYAPPPDLTSNNPKSYQTPAPNFFTPSQPPTSATVGDFFIPTTAVASISNSQSSPDSLSNLANFPTTTGNLQSSRSFSSGFPTTTTNSASSTFQTTNFSNFPQSRPIPGQCNPGVTNWSAESSFSSPREIPSRFPETATPRNTPANSNFAGFASSYASNQTENLLSNARTDQRISTINSGPTNFSEGITFDVPSSAYTRNKILPISSCTIEPNVSTETNDSRGKSSETEDNSFTAISAAKVTAKLEHLLAEREEDSSILGSSNLEPPLAFSEDSKSVENEKSNLSINSSEETVVKKSENSEDLADIDLTANESLANVSSTLTNVPESLISGTLDFPPALGNESFARSGSHLSTPAEINVSSKSSSIADSFVQHSNPETLPSVVNFFNTTEPTKTQELNYFSTDNETRDIFYNPSTLAQNQGATTSSFFDPGQRVVGSDGRSAFLTAATNSQHIAGINTLQAVPTFYNPGEFTTNPRDPGFSVFDQQIPSVGGISTQSPFNSSVLGSSPPNFPVGGSFMATSVPESTGSATLNPVQMSVNPGIVRSSTDTVPPSLQNLASGPVADRRMQYRPVYHHWFYRKEVENKILWLPFSMQDSLRLEEIHNSPEITTETSVATDGGRYDVDILRRVRKPAYWTGNSTEVRRSSWFYKGSAESRYIPYDESTSARLEDEYKQACSSDNWNRRVELNNGEYIIFHSSTIQVHHMPPTSPELAASWGNSADSETATYLQGAASRPRVVKRGVDEFNIDEGEPETVDHLLFLVHGIGSVCDLKFRTVEEVVDEFRSISLQLVQSHYRTASMHGIVNRIEVLPISWHTTLHSEDTGIDKKLQAITLESIPKLRHFTNDTLLDILFYTSPIYCQTIMQTVGNEMNRLYSLFKERNPNFGGSVYLGGHSLGSLILFDLLCNQKPPAEESRDETDPTPSNPDNKSDDDTVDSLKSMTVPILKRRLSKKVSYVMGSAGTGQPFINYPQLSFLPQAFFALGSPIGMFVTVRGIDTLGEDFALPTCPAFFNVFHPFDPVAYRVESLINPEAQKYRPMLIPHHKGRKRMHLELKETMARVGADLKQKLLDSVRSTWNSVYQLAMFHRPDNQSLEQEIEKVVEEQLHKSPSVHEQQNDDDGGADFRVGQLNGGRRVDYVLQEAPFEYINEYIFALTSHVCYWESEDTMLMILKEIYGTNGVQADVQLPPQTMTIERVSPSPSIATISGVSTPLQNPSGTTTPMGFDPTAPIASKPVGPPPISGFVRKS